MGLPIPPRPPAPDGLLDRFAAQRVTGALRGPHGCVYLLDGAVTCVECAARHPGSTYASPRPARCPRRAGGRPWTPPGRSTASASSWSARAGDAGRTGDLPPGGPPRRRLLRPAAAPAEATSFTPGSAHWLGACARSAPPPCSRRRPAAGRSWPAAALGRGRQLAGRARLRPCGRARTTAGQRRLLERADGRHTPYELARSLGQSAFVTLLDIRRLAAAGLVRVPSPAALPRRRPGACLDGPPPGPAHGRVHPDWQLPVPDLLDTADPDIALLIRLRTALEENL